MNKEVEVLSRQRQTGRQINKKKDRQTKKQRRWVCGENRERERFERERKREIKYLRVAKIE